jgi:hypothetical protein
MSEATIEALESEAYESIGEASYEGEGTETAYEGEGVGEAAYEGYGEDARSDARRRARQRQIMLARQRQAQSRRPQPPRRPVVAAPSQTMRAVRSPDLETKAALDSLRHRLNEANRLAYRNAWAAEASAAASQALDSFENNLKPHDWARALIRGAPTLLLAPGKPRKPGIEGILFDPRVGGGALLAAIWAFGHFRSQPGGVSRIDVHYAGSLTTTGAHHTNTLTAVAFDKAGNVLPNVTFTYVPLDATLFTITEEKPGVATLTGNTTGNTWLQVTAAGKNSGTYVTVT